MYTTWVGTVLPEPMSSRRRQGPGPSPGLERPTLIIEEATSFHGSWKPQDYLGTYFANIDSRAATRLYGQEPPRLHMRSVERQDTKSHAITKHLLSSQDVSSPQVLTPITPFILVPCHSSRQQQHRQPINHSVN